MKGAVSQEFARCMAMHFEDLLLGCSVTLSKACNGKAWLNIKSLAGKALDSISHSQALISGNGNESATGVEYSVNEGRNV